MSLQSVLAGFSKEISRLKSVVSDLDRRLVTAPLNAGKAKRLTIATGAVEATRPYIHLAPESGTADTLNTISNGSEGKIIVLSAADAGNTITVNNYSVDSGNIDLLGAATSIDLADEHDSLMLLYRESTAHWEQIGGGGSGGGAVDSVNGQTGVVVLDSDDIAEGATNLYFTAAEKTKLAGIETAADVTDAGNVGAAINGTTEKTTPVAADRFAIINSVGSVLAWVSWTNILATAKAYFDTLYTAISTAVLLTGAQTVAGAKTWSSNAIFNALVGIGTASPNFKLTVVGDGAAPESSAVLTSQTGVIAVFGDGHAYLLTRDVTNNIEGLMGTSTVGAVFFGAMTAHDLQLRTANVTRVTVQDSTGNVGIGTASPDRKLVVEDTTASVLMSVRKVSGAEVMIQVQATFGAIGTITNHPLHLTTNNTVKASILANGDMGLGTTSPQGKLHVHDGTGGMLFVSKTGIVGSAQTIIPDGTGDVTKRAMFIGIASSSFPEANMIQVTVAPGGNVDTTYSGGVLRFSVSAGGALTVIRQSGASTFSISGTVIWQ